MGTEDVRNLTSNFIKSKMKYFSVPKKKEWRVGCLKELLNERLEVPDFTENEIKDFVSYICSS